MARLQRLKERKLVQWTLAYLAGAWVVLQVVDVLGDQWGWSQGLQRSISVLLAAGLLVALVLAWFHGERGKQEVTFVEAALLVTLGTVGVGFAWSVGTGAPPDGVSPPVVDNLRPDLAALPFVNRSGVDADAYFTDGMRDEILTRLIKLSGIRVVSRTSVLGYRDTTKPLPQISAELGSRYILEGGLLRAGGDVRIDVKLFDGRTDSQLWAEDFTRALSIDNLLAIQSEIAERVASALSATIEPDELAEVAAPTTTDLTALDLYFLARSRWAARDPESIDQAISLFQQALDIDSGFARAHAGLADALAIQSFHYLTRDADRWDEAEVSARLAIELDGTLAEAHTSFGFILTYGHWDWSAADEAFSTAIRLDPEYPVAHYWDCELLIAIRRPDQAERACKTAIDVDRRSAVAYNVLNQLYYNEGRLEEGLEAAKAAARFAPDWPAAYNQLSVFYAEMGDSAGFRESFPKSALGFLDADLAYRALGPTPDTQAAIGIVEVLDRSVSAHTVAGWVFAMNGMEDSAVARLHLGIEGREEFFPLVSPAVARFMDDATALSEIERRMNLPHRP